MWVLALLRPGDYLTLAAGALATALLAVSFWRPGNADTVIVRSDGKVFAELPLAQDGKLSVWGPLGESIVEVADGKARIASDPSPRQYCVTKGWLASVGEVAICLPNRVGIEIAGADRSYDSLNY